MTDSINCRIFIVEDDLMYRKMLTYMFKSDNSIELHVFENGQSCLDQIQQKPDLILLDYTLPDYTGEEMLVKLRAIDQELRVIMLSGVNDPEIIKGLFNQGAYDYIIKDKLTKTRLLNAIKHVKAYISLKEKVEHI